MKSSQRLQHGRLASPSASRSSTSQLFHIYVNGFALVLSTSFQVLAEELLRLSVLISPGTQLEQTREGHEEAWAGTSDPAFTRVWWIATGWAMADVVITLGRGTTSSRFTRSSRRTPVLARVAGLPSPCATVRRAQRQPRRLSASATAEAAEEATTQVPVPTPVPHPHHSLSIIVRSIQPNQEILTPDLETQLSHLLALKSRAELDDVYDSPLPAIPLSLMFLRRLDAVLLSLGLTLALGAVCVSARDCPPCPGASSGRRAGEGDGDGPTWMQVWAIVPTFVLVGVHFALGAIWTGCVAEEWGAYYQLCRAVSLPWMVLCGPWWVGGVGMME